MATRRCRRSWPRGDPHLRPPLDRAVDRSASRSVPAPVRIGRRPDLRLGEARRSSIHAVELASSSLCTSPPAGEPWPAALQPASVPHVRLLQRGADSRHPSRAKAAPVTAQMFSVAISGHPGSASPEHDHRNDRTTNLLLPDRLRRRRRTPSPLRPQTSPGGSAEGPGPSDVRREQPRPCWMGRFAWSVPYHAPSERSSDLTSRG